LALYLIGFLRELQKLIVQSNQLASLPRAIGHLARLTYLSVGENNLSFIPEEIGNHIPIPFLSTVYLILLFINFQVLWKVWSRCISTTTLTYTAFHLS